MLLGRLDEVFIGSVNFLQVLFLDLVIDNSGNY